MPTKRNAQGGGSIRQRKDGTWEARFTVGRNLGTGKQMQKSVYGKTQKEVRQKLTLATASLDDGTYIEPSRLSIGAWLDIWLSDYIKPSVKPLTHEEYAMQCRNHIIPFMGAIKLKALNAPMIQSFYNYLQSQTTKDNKPKRALSAKSIKNVHGILHKALEKAVVLDMIRTNPSNACTLPNVVKKEVIPLDEQGIATFLDVVKGHRYEHLYKIALFTGMRQSELIGLMWSQVCFNTSVITVDKQLQRKKEKNGEYFISTTKNNKTRRITVASAVMDILNELKTMQDKFRDEYNVIPVDDYVFTDIYGKHYSHKSVIMCFRRLVSKMGLPATRFHDLRHSYAVISLEAGDNPKTVQENLGHHSVAFTLDVYGHITEKMKFDSAKRMDAFINRFSSKG